MRRREALVGIGGFGVGVLTGCGGGSSPTGASDAVPTPPAPTPAPASDVLVGAGDIGWPGLPGARITGELLDGIPGTVFTAGDNAYMHGTSAEFAANYEPFWGRHKARTRPCPGNHEYETDRGRPYFEYYGGNAGPAQQGWYDYRVGSWLVLSLNSAARIDRNSAQYAWVRTTLTATPAAGVVAYWHHPLFSSGENGPNRGMADLWRLLHERRVDVVVNGHDHWYECFAPQDADGHPDPSGPRQFTVGTGGARPYGERRIAANSEERITGRFGVLKLVLLPGSYRWEFITPDGALDQGTESVR